VALGVSRTIVARQSAVQGVTGVYPGQLQGLPHPQSHCFFSTESAGPCASPCAAKEASFDTYSCLHSKVICVCFSSGGMQRIVRVNLSIRDCILSGSYNLIGAGFVLFDEALYA
jgi:hypothetical protein